MAAEEEIRVKDVTPTIDAFRTGDKMLIDGPSGTANMSKDTLLTLTAQNALGSIKSLATTKYKGFMALDDADGTGKMDVDTIFNNFAQDYVSAVPYPVGECFLYQGELVQAIKPIQSNDYDPSKVIKVPIGLNQMNTIGAGIITPFDMMFTGKGSSLISSPLFRVIQNVELEINIAADWESSATQTQNKFCIICIDEEGTEYIIQSTQVIGNDPVWSSQKIIFSNSAYKFFRVIARAAAGESVSVSFKYDFGQFVQNYGDVNSPSTRTVIFALSGNNSLTNIPIYGVGGGKYVKISFAADWNDSSVTFNKLYLREFKVDGTYTDSLELAAGSSVPRTIKFRTNDDTVYCSLRVRGNQGEQVSVTINVGEVTDRQKVSPMLIQRGDAEIGANVEPGYTTNHFTSRCHVVGYHNMQVQAGDTICVKSGFRVYIGFSTTGIAPYTTSGWVMGGSKYLVKADGYICVCFSTVGDADFDNIETFAENFFFMTDCDTGISPADILKRSMQEMRCSVYGVNHRGYNKIAPENTLPAFRMSHKVGFKWVETDLRYSSDGVPVLIHDATVDRTSDGSGNVDALTIDQLKALDFGSWKNASYAGTRIPTFDEFLGLVIETGLKVVLEIKAGLFATFYDSVFKKIQKADIADKFFFMIDSETWLAAANSSLAGANLVYLVGDSITGAEDFFDGLTNSNGNKYYIATSKVDIIDTADGIACKYPLFSWTIDAPKYIIKQVGLRGVISNAQDASRAILEYYAAPIQNVIR